MDLSFFTVFYNVGILVALGIPGFILKKSGLVEERAQKSLVAILLFVCQPMLIIKSFQAREYSSGMLLHLAIALGVSVVIHAVMYIISRFAFPYLKAENRIHSFSTVFSNSSYLGIPLLAVLFKDNPEALVYASVYGIAFSLLVWTLGIYVVTGKKEFISVKKGIINPPTLTLFIALPLFFFGISLPSEIMKGVAFLGDMSTPLSMIIIGIRLADVKLELFYKSLKSYLASALRLIVSPLIMITVLVLFANKQNAVLFQSLVILSSMPVAFTTVLFAERTGADSNTAAVNVTVSTVLSLITIPLVTSLMLYITEIVL